MSEQAERQTVQERLTVGIIPKSAGDLRDLVELTGLSKANVINRALGVYAFVARHLAEGDDLLVRNRETGEVERVHVI